MIEKHLKLFASLNERKVEYLLIGGALSIAYGVPRVTKDIDLFLNPELKNAERCLEGLRHVGLETAKDIDAHEICATEITIFKDVIRLDILTHVKGLDFSTAWKNKVLLELGTVRIPALAIDDLILAKKASGRPDDLQDIAILSLAKASKKE